VLRGHSARAGALSWRDASSFSSGSRDSAILQRDVRVSSDVVATYAGHQQEVCGLEWNADGRTLASGGNENYLCLWGESLVVLNDAVYGVQYALACSTMLHKPESALSYAQTDSGGS
jgi:WD40 repeat protein